MDNNHFNKEDKNENLEELKKEELEKEDNLKEENLDEKDFSSEKKDEPRNKENEENEAEKLEKRRKIAREKQVEFLKNKIKEEEEKKNSKNSKNNNKKGNNGGFGGLNFKGLLLLVFLITLIFSLTNMRFTQRDASSTEISYTQFTDKIKDKELVKIEEKSGYITGYGHETEDENGVATTPIFRTRLLGGRLGFDGELVSLLQANNVEIISLAPDEPNILVNMLTSSFPILLMIGVWVFMLNRMNKGSGGGGPQIFNMGKSKTKDGENISKVTFKDVAGIVESKKELEEVVEFLKEPDKFKNVGAKIPKGVLLLGPPGTGKTLLAKAVAGEAKVPFFSMSGSEFVEMFVGVGASRVRDLFNKARKNAPCIIFIDEIDAVGRKRGTGSGGGNDEREQTLNQMLVEMDGFGNEETIIVLAATNRPDVLDRALLRPGRFDRRVYVDMPDRNGRKAILEVHSKGKKIGKDVDFDAISKQTAGLAGADLANLLNEAAILAARVGRKEITMEDIQEATEKAAMGPAKKSKVINEKEREITAYHEAGHAVAGYCLPNANPVYKITIVPRGFTGGFTMYLPDEKEERIFRLKSEYMDELIYTFGGRAAEEIVYGDISTGASGDIRQATAVAHAMVTKFGMADKFGPILLDNTQEGDMFQSRLYSDVTGKEIDDEIRKIINESYSKCLEILTTHRKELEDVTRALLEKDTINRDEFEAIMRGENL